MVRETVVKASNFFCQESDSGRRLAQTHKKDGPTQRHSQAGGYPIFSRNTCVSFRSLVGEKTKRLWASANAKSTTER